MITLAEKAREEIKQLLDQAWQQTEADQKLEKQAECLSLALGSAFLEKGITDFNADKAAATRVERYEACGKHHVGYWIWSKEQALPDLSDSYFFAFLTGVAIVTGVQLPKTGEQTYKIWPIVLQAAASKQNLAKIVEMEQAAAFLQGHPLLAVYKAIFQSEEH